MIKQVWIAECDLCGKQEEMKSKQGRYDETEHVLPEGWGHTHNKNFHLCPKCNGFLDANRLIIQRNKEA